MLHLPRSVSDQFGRRTVSDPFGPPKTMMTCSALPKHTVGGKGLPLLTSSAHVKQASGTKIPKGGREGIPVGRRRFL
jgi:hypothetical protein